MLLILFRRFEKLTFNQLYDYLDKNKLIYYKQCLFKSLNFAVACLLKSTDDWYLNMNESRFTLTVFIDLKKAFDTVNCRYHFIVKSIRIYFAQCNYFISISCFMF